MLKTVRGMGERLLDLVVPKAEAGACIPEHGSCCPNRYHRRYDCYGGCTVVSSTCP